MNVTITNSIDVKYAYKWVRISQIFINVKDKLTQNNNTYRSKSTLITDGMICHNHKYPIYIHNTIRCVSGVPQRAQHEEQSQHENVFIFYFISKALFDGDCAPHLCRRSDPIDNHIPSHAS